MKKWFVFVSLLLLVVLAACGASGGTNGTATKTAGLKDGYDDALSIAGQLALGSLKMEETELALTESQAETMLPLWQAYQTLSNSETAAEVEVNSLLKQIQNTLTEEQLTTIAAMQLTNADVTTWMEESGASMGRGSFAGTDSEGDATQRDFGGGFPAGGMAGGMGGGMPAGGFGGGVPGAGAMGGVVSGDTSELAESDIDIEAMMATMSERMLINSVIRQLQVKTGVEIEDPMQGGRAMMEEMMAAVAEVIDVPAETLQSEMAEGNTLSQVITNHGVDLEQAAEEIKSILVESPTFEDQDLDQLLSNWLQSGQ